MVIIRLSRGGAKKRPFYKIIVTDSRNSKDNNYIEKIGYYNPCISIKKKYFYISEKRLNFWKNLGAKLSYTVIRLIKNFKKI